MTVATMLTVTCDAPGCGSVLETLDAHPVFATLDDVREAADVRQWAIWKNHRGTEEFYCERHWRWHFGAKHPYWGRKDRDT